jgi:hypothetical protein
MGKNSDITSISNSLGITILHEIVVENTNKLETIPHLRKEISEYRGQSLKKLDKTNLNEKDKKQIKEKVVRKIQSILRSKYPDIKVSQKDIKKRVDKELFYFFE